MIEFIQEAGWGIYPVFFFGALCLGFSIRHSVQPDAGMLPLVIGTGVALLLCGVLGTITGLQVAVRYIAELGADERWLFLVGLREALNNMVAALVLAALSTMVATAGSYRAHRMAKATAA
ncbi:MAG: hypothetical protein R3B82_22530 [Sandaracinaceae bacterium]